MAQKKDRLDRLVQEINKIPGGWENEDDGFAS